MNIKEEIKSNFIQKFCNDHNGEVRFLRSIFWDEKDGAEEILKFISDSIDKVIQAKNKEFEEKIKSCPCDFDWTIDDNLFKGYNMAMQEIQNWQTQGLK